MVFDCFMFSARSSKMVLDVEKSPTELSEKAIRKRANIYLLTLAKKGSTGDHFVITRQSDKAEISSNVEAIMKLEIPNYEFLPDNLPISKLEFIYFGLIVDSLACVLEGEDSLIVSVKCAERTDVTILITLAKDGDKTVLTACKQS
jgi:hypothetical protein